MFRVEDNGRAFWCCSECSMAYSSQAAAKACEDTHQDERPVRVPRKKG